MTADVVIETAEVQRRLAEALPHWYLEGGSLRRRVRTGGWKATLMVVNAVAHLAEAAWHHPDLSVTYAAVVIKLVTHSAGGITEKDFQLARKIEEVVFWRPAGEPGSALEGTPQDDPRVRYVKFDDAS